MVGAPGGAGGTGGAAQGGNGGDGRIRIEYCDTLTGTTTPAASTQKLDCFIAEQVETPPYDTTRLTVPETFTGSRTYRVQYGRKLDFAGSPPPDQNTVIRVPSSSAGDATMEVLLSGLTAGSNTVCIDIGADGNNDWCKTETTGVTAAYTAIGLAGAFNAYLSAHPAPSTTDVPVRVSMTGPGQVLLTNLQLTPSGGRLRGVRLAAATYSSVTLGLSVGTAGGSAGQFSLFADVGDNGSVDWTFSGARSFPATITTGVLAAAVNAYLAGKSGEVDVPVRFVTSPELPVSVIDVQARTGATPDLTFNPGDITFSNTTPTDGDTVTVNVVLRNSGGRDSGPVTFALLATPPGGLEFYAGGGFVANVPAGGASAPTPVAWNTLGYAGNATGVIPGAVAVRVVADPGNRLLETLKTNNTGSASLTVRTRPELAVTAEGLAGGVFEPVAGTQVAVPVTLRNDGQTPVGSATVHLYAGDPAAGGVLIGSASAAAPGNGTADLMVNWTPPTAGAHTLYAVTDQANTVTEQNETNNKTSRVVHVGFTGARAADSGDAANDLAYSPARGYGAKDDNGQADVLFTCPSSTRTLRRDPAGVVSYQFDHLQPGRSYHLDLTLAECDGARRVQSVKVDGVVVAGGLLLAGGNPMPLGILLDPALYADRAIVVTVEAPGIDGAVIDDIKLSDIDYRYADSGAAADPLYPGTRGYGYLDGVGLLTWGTLPYKSVRVNQSGPSVPYRFDGLSAAKRYHVTTVLYQQEGTARSQKLQIDGVDAGPTVDLGDYQIHRVTVDVPVSAYTGDGSIVVAVVRTNGDTGAVVSEIALQETTSGPTGDVNADGFVNVTDALCILRVVAGLEATASCPSGLSEPDVNGDGNVTATDALCILRAVAGLEPTAGCPALTIAGGVSGAVVSVPGVPTVELRLNPASAAVSAAGVTVEVLLAAGPARAGAWTFDLTFDPEVVWLASCTGENGGLCNAGAGPGRARVTGASAAGVGDSARLATLVFQPGGRGGATAVNFAAVLFADASGGALNVNPLAATLTAGGDGSLTPTATPCPNRTGCPTATATVTPTAVACPTRGACPTATASATVSATTTVSPTAAACARPGACPAATPTLTPTPPACPERGGCASPAAGARAPSETLSRAAEARWATRN